MARKISATTAARKLSEVLDRVEHSGEEFLVERHGRAVAAIIPAAPAGRITWADLRLTLQALPRPDRRFAGEMKRIRRAQPRLPKDRWGSSSTARS